MDLIQRCIDRIEKPKDGAPGKDGRDGFNLEDFHSELAEDGRTLTLAFIAGENRMEHKHVLPHVIYRGVHQQGKQYQRGDSVTFQGSTWIAMRDTGSKPETDDSWKLATKRGRDGKDGLKGEKGERGVPGKSEQR
jgi:integrin beta 3